MTTYDDLANAAAAQAAYLQATGHAVGGEEIVGGPKNISMLGHLGVAQPGGGMATVGLPAARPGCQWQGAQIPPTGPLTAAGSQSGWDLAWDARGTLWAHTAAGGNHWAKCVPLSVAPAYGVGPNGPQPQPTPPINHRPTAHLSHPITNASQSHPGYGYVGDSPSLAFAGDVGPGQTAVITSRWTDLRPFHGTGLVTPDGVRAYFSIVDLKIRNRSQLVNVSPMPIPAYLHLTLDTISQGQDVSIVVVNTSTVPRSFQATIDGAWAS